MCNYEKVGSCHAELPVFFPGSQILLPDLLVCEGWPDWVDPIVTVTDCPYMIVILWYFYGTKSCYGVIYLYAFVVQHSWWHCSKVLDLRSTVVGSILTRTKLHNNLGQGVQPYVLLSPSSIILYWSKNGDVFWLGKWLQAWWKVMATYSQGRLRKSLSGWLAVLQDQLRTECLVTSVGELYLYLYNVSARW